MTNALPWHYIPGQFLARLPEGSCCFSASAFVLATVTAVRFVRATIVAFRARGIDGLAAPALLLARSRGTLLVIAAAIVPIGFVILTRATHYDGVRHVLFVIPMLALLAGGAAAAADPVAAPVSADRRHGRCGGRDACRDGGDAGEAASAGICRDEFARGRNNGRGRPIRARLLVGRRDRGA